MTTIRMATRAEIASNSDDRIVTVTVSTETMGRDGFVMMSQGIDLTYYRANPVVLFQHDPSLLVATTIDIGVLDAKLIARVKFPTQGISATADETYGLLREGILNAASTGVQILETEPLDPANPKAGTRILRCELQEFSFVSIPAVPDALVIERALKEAKEQMVTTDTPDPRAAVMKTRMLKRGLYEVGSLAYLLMELGWIKDTAEWEAECEQDGSTVPAQLGAALQALGATLVAMTAEEVAELVGGDDVEPVVEVVAEPEIVAGDIVTLSAIPAAKRFALGVSRARKAHQVAIARTAKVTRGMVVHRRMANLYERELIRV